MNLYGIIRFYTAFSGRLMGDGSIFKLVLDPKDNSYHLSEPLIIDRVISLGLVSEDDISKIGIPKGLVDYHKPSNSIIFKSKMVAPCDDDNESFEIHIFHEVDDANVKLLVDIKGMEGVWNL